MTVTEPPDVASRSDVLAAIAQNQERIRQGHNALVTDHNRVVEVLDVMNENVTQLREDVDDMQGERPNWQRCWAVAAVVWGLMMVFGTIAVFKWHWDGFIGKPADVDRDFVSKYRFGEAMKDIFAFSSLVALLVLLLMSFHESRVTAGASSTYRRVRSRFRRGPVDSPSTEDVEAEDVEQDDNDLVLDNEGANQATSVFPTPRQTLEAIEADPRLMELLQSDLAGSTPADTAAENQPGPSQN